MNRPNFGWFWMVLMFFSRFLTFINYFLWDDFSKTTMLTTDKWINQVWHSLTHAHWSRLVI
jgi:hypothetical protein